MKKLILLIFTLSFALLGQAQVTKTVYSTAGTLYSRMTATELSTVTNLIITGTIDSRDFVTMRYNMNKLAVVDISNVTISAYIGTQGTVGTASTTYPANAIPQNAFFFTNSNVGKITLTNIIFPNSVTSIGSNAFYDCTGLTSVTIPNSVTSIGSGAFEACTGLTNITLPNSVTSIGSNAFGSCTGLTSLNIPNSVTSIGYGAFDGCTGLINITLPNSVTFIGEAAFSDCQRLTNITLPNSVTSIGSNTFAYCPGLTGTLTIPSSVTSIGEQAFFSCTGLTGTLTIPSSVTSIGADAFYECTGLTNITLPNSITFIGSQAFAYCPGLTSLTIPNSIISIGSQAFSGCTGLISLTIPNSVDSIGSVAFGDCTGLTSLTIPSSVTSIGQSSFEGCTGLTSIYANSTLPINLSSSWGVFYNVNTTTCTLYVPVGSKSAYQAATQWKDFLNIVETTTAIQNVNNLTISLYPNPTNESFQIKGVEGTALITIRDLNGKTLLSKQITGNENISVSSLSKGVYILEITTIEGAIEKKIVKD